MNDNESVKNAYNQIADQYSASRDLWKSSGHLERFVRFLPPAARILDIGCGSGVPVDTFLLSKGYRVTGLDISDRQIALARKQNPTGSYEVRDMQSLRPGQYQADGVVAFYSIFHISRELHESIFHIFRSFLPSGGVVLATMGASDWEGTEDDFHGASMFWSHYGPDRNRQIIENAGFVIVSEVLDESGDEKHQIFIAEAV